MDIAYISENKIMQLTGGITSEVPCGRIIKYREALDSIRRKTEWKTQGSGAQFMGQASDIPDTSEIAARISAIAKCSVEGQDGDRLLYGAALDQSGCLYHRSFDRADQNEGLILSGNDTFFGSFDCRNGKVAASMGTSLSSLHIAVLEPPSSQYTEYTDGDTTEEFPSWSRCRNGIYFSTSGYARDEYGAIGAQSPKAGAFLDLDTNDMQEVLSDENTDYIRVKDDEKGNLYYIRQPYGGTKESDSIKFTDILFFVPRLIKGLFGWLNFMCTIWGGESLKKGDGNTPAGFAKMKNKSQRDLIIEGNIIKADKLAKEKELKDDDMSGFMPLTRVLVKRTPDGKEEIIRRGVLDYTLCDEGILVSDGRQIILIADGKETRITKARFAQSIIVL